MLARKALAGTAGAPKVYVEDVFSTYLWDGTAATRSITNNIDLSGKGGMVWIKSRSNAYSHRLFDTNRGATKELYSNLTNAETTTSTSLTAFNNDGFSLGAAGGVNDSGSTYVGWTFRKAEKFFDVVTYSGNSVDDRAINHNLGSTPGCVIVRRLSGDDWYVYHRSLTSASYGLRLNKTDSESSNTATVKSVSSTTFTVGTDGMVNVSGSDYVAYLFAHDAGGFGDAGSDNIITCGSFTSDVSSNATVNLGWEPQWIIMKQSSNTAGWWMVNNMMPFVASPGTTTKYLSANLTDAEADWGSVMEPTATGFKGTGLGASRTYIYIAIRRGPMKTPTSGTSVFTPTSAVDTTQNAIINAGFPVDLVIGKTKDNTNPPQWSTRMLGGSYLLSSATDAETAWNYVFFDSNVGYRVNASGTYLNSANTVNWMLRRAPGFFDVVCYTGTGSATTFSHNLGVAPELYVVKRRNSTDDWWVYAAPLGNTKTIQLNLTSAASTDSTWNNTSPTSSVFSVGGTGYGVNNSGATYVAYLFASVSGVSKVGSYTGNGSSVTVTTDFQPRFILVKRTDSTGDWIVSDSARGLVAGSDPYLLLNSSAAEVTNEDWVDISSTSFTVNQTTNNANVNTGTYIYLAIA